ncbi:unnamed protein product [Withania somnifera]
MKFWSVILVVAAAVAAEVVVVVGGGAEKLPVGVLSLERIVPLNRKVEVEEVRARDRARHARMLQSFGGGIVDFPVVGSSDPYLVGLYFTKVRLGTPPREYNVQIDTGSDILWVTCSSCDDCPRTSGLGVELNFYDATGSSTATPISCANQVCASILQTASAECSTETSQCGYTFKYGDGSGTTGHYVADLLYFDTVLGTSLIANSSAPIVFGVHYNVYLQSIAVNGQLVPVDPSVFATSGNRGTIVDSGTTLAYIAAEAYDPFVSAITAAVSQSARPIVSRARPCFLVSSSIAEIFPPVSLNFEGGASMALRPADYLVHMGFLEGSAMWCIGFERQEQGVTILGDLVLKDKIIVYDLAQQRIGWTDYDCSSSVNVSITSGNGEFINAGQLSVNGASGGALFNLQHTRTSALLLLLVLMIGSLFLT